MNITVVDYNPDWKRKYETEARRISALLGENLVAIYHIGSTSVEGLKAKPIIDIMPVVRDLSLVDEKRSGFEELGYEYMGEFGIPGRRYLRKGGDNRTHQIHIFGRESQSEILRHLAVPAYLRAHKDAAREYGQLKEELAQKYPHDIDGYCDGKDAFVKKLEQEALFWYRCQSPAL